jgi:hypothetical protein
MRSIRGEVEEKEHSSGDEPVPPVASSPGSQSSLVVRLLSYPIVSSNAAPDSVIKVC